MNKNHGFTLVEVLVVVAIIGVVSFGISSVLINSIKSDVGFRMRMETNELEKEVDAIMNSENCGMPDLASGVSVKTWDKDEKYELASGLSSSYLTIKKDNMYGKVGIKGVSITGFFNKTDNSIDYFPLDGDKSTATTFKASASIEFDETKNRNVPLAPLYLPITITVSSGKIVGCTKQANSDLTLDICENTLGGTFDEDTGKCDLPCPAGLVEIGGECRQPSEDGYLCDHTERCNAQQKYVL